MMHELHKRGYPADTEATGDRGRVQVRVGPYPSLSQTQQMMHKLGNDGFSVQFDTAAKGRS